MHLIQRHKEITILGIAIADLLLAGSYLYITQFAASEPNTTTPEDQDTSVTLPPPEASEAVDSSTTTPEAEPEQTIEQETEPEPEQEPTQEQESDTSNELPINDPVYAEEDLERFVVERGATQESVAIALQEQGYIENEAAFRVAFSASGGTEIEPGGYKLAKGMNAETIVSTLQEAPYMKWIVIPEGYRKEQIAELLTQTLGWTETQKNEWINTYTEMEYDHIEGVYFPDTYLIPTAEKPLEVAERLIAKFNERFAPYLQRFNHQNIKWTTGLTMASIVQREASSNADMPLIAGILWNRLDEGMYLNVDATLQYVRGNTGAGWWAPIDVEDKQIDSQYNTYTYRGLPPHPIANPGIPAIEAVLNPAETDCLYYLHDPEGETHCAETYEEHQDNIDEYLKDND